MYAYRVVGYNHVLSGTVLDGRNNIVTIQWSDVTTVLLTHRVEREGVVKLEPAEYPGTGRLRVVRLGRWLPFCP